VASTASAPGWSRRTIPEVLDEQARDRPGQVFLHLAGVAVTYSEMQELSRRGAVALRQLGVRPGDRMAVMMATSTEWVVAWLSAARLGAVIVPVNPAYRGDFLANQLIDSRSSVLCIDRSLVERVSEIGGRLQDVRHILVREDTGSGGATSPVGVPGAQVLSIGCLGQDISAALADGDGEVVPATSWHEPTAIFYTSGTTGRSKGAVTTHQYLLSAGAAMVDCWDLQPGETIYAPLPLFHLSAVGSVLGPLLAGGTGVIDQAFSVSNTWDQVRRYQACGILLAGPMVVMLWNLPLGPDDASLPIRFLSAAPVPGELYHQIEARYGCKIVTVYGLSEAFPVTYAGVRDDNPPGASGQPNPRLDVAIVDDHDTEVPPGTTGEIVCRPRESHVIFEGYDGRPAETLEQLGSLWFHTGDLGRFDEERNLTYVDRKKDSLRRRGENISSFEVEQAILGHPAIAEVAAIGVASDLGEDDLLVCLTAKPGADLNVTEFMDFCVKRMPRFAVPRYVEIVDELPKNVIGRILKPELRRRGVTSTTWDREEVGYVVGR
jgi:carnitine-CoA ligase